jgi:drug efflux transport system ATP-binding protein
MLAISAENITKKYGKVTALNGISFEVEKGELFGFIGPDGAGKTTLFRLITSLLVPDQGKLNVMGNCIVKDYKQIRTLCGYMPGRFSLYQDLSVEENLKFFASIFNTSIEENYDLIKDIYSQIEPFKTRKAGDLSGGMKQKLALSCALIHKPEVLVLDEPTTGVDAVSRKEFWEMLKNLKAHGITIVVSTPYMDEADLCDRVALIHKSNILHIDKPSNLNKLFGKQLFAIKHRDTYQLLQTLRASEYADSVYPFGEFVHYTDKREAVELSMINEYLSKTMTDIEIHEIEPNIEDTFMELTREDFD